MRTIKYRVWDTEYKEMLYDELMLSASGSLYCNYAIGKIRAFPANSYVTQQFTGVQDANKKDLYEGDILKVKGYFKGESEEFSIGVVEWNERDCGFCINIYKDGKPYWEIYHMNEIQERNEFFIVGNIFENPELLK